MENKVKVKPPAPQVKHVYWEITHRCNLRCITCFASDNISKKDLTLEDLFRIAGKLASYNPEIQISGGEPFIRHDLMKLLHYLKDELSIGRVVILTNGTLLKREYLEQLRQWDIHFQISLDGATPETNDFIRGKGVFSRVINTLNMLKNAGIENVTVKMTPIHLNIRETEALRMMVEEQYGFAFSSSLFEPSGRGINLHNDENTKKMLVKFYEQLSNQVTAILKKLSDNCSIISEFPVVQYVTEQITLNGYPLCSVGRRDGFMIDSRGDVYLCPSLRDNEFKLGNILSENVEPVDFLKRWKPPFIDKFERCNTCPVKYFCAGGGCIARNLAFTGKLTEPSPYCKFFGVITEAVIYDRLHEQKDCEKIKQTLYWIEEEFRKEAVKYK